MMISQNTLWQLIAIITCEKCFSIVKLPVFAGKLAGFLYAKCAKVDFLRQFCQKMGLWSVGEIAAAGLLAA